MEGSTMPQEREWRALVTWRHPAPHEVDDDRLNVIVQALPGFAIVQRTLDRLRAEMTVQAPTIRQAAEAAARAARAAHAHALGEQGELVSLRVLTLEEHDYEISRPGAMDLVGLKEAAELLGISHQRVDQLWRTNPEFPAPVAQLSAGAIFTRASILAAQERGWKRRPPGRPRKAG
ncbi:hypothetical protein K1W54_28820 [Micromonospora sp. CPCC 205371]|nr:hypothetical protein [Micromonospora sp. CPCC 205371]